VPAPTCFGVEFMNKVLSVQQVFQVLSPLTSVAKVKRIKLLKLQITHHQVYVHIGAQTTPQSDEPPLLHNHSHFSGLFTQTSVSICDPKGFCPAEGCTVHVRVHSVPLSTLYTLKWDTVHPSAGRDPFGSHINTDVCVHSPKKWPWLCHRGGSSLWGVVCAPICTYTWWCVIRSFNSNNPFNFCNRSKGR
jgi:hypothetical protein